MDETIEYVEIKEKGNENDVLKIAVKIIDGETAAINIAYSKNFLRFLKGDEKQRDFLLAQIFNRLNKSIDEVG